MVLPFIFIIIGSITVLHALLSSGDAQEFVSKTKAVVGTLVFLIGLMGMVAPHLESDLYKQGVLDHAAGLVQVDSTWESRITIKKIEE